MYTSVIGLFAEAFRGLEEDNSLDRLNDIDLFCLHYIYLPRINESLTSFTHGWNNHRISTEHGRTPLQLHVVGLLTEDQAPINAVPSFISSTLNPGILLPEPNEGVDVPESSFEPCETLVRAMEVVDPLNNVTDFGKTLYLSTVNIVGTHLSAGCDNCTIG